MSPIDGIIEKLTAYVHVKTEQMKLKIIEKVSRILANVIAFSFIAALGTLFVFFLSFGIGSILNEALDSTYWGHLIVAGFYLILVIIIFLLVKGGKLQNWLEDLLLTIDIEDEPQD